MLPVKRGCRVAGGAERRWWPEVKLLDSNQPFPSTDEEALQYLPDHPSARGLYECRRELGDTITEAMIATLEACYPEAVKAANEQQPAAAPAQEGGE